MRLEREARTSISMAVGVPQVGVGFLIVALGMSYGSEVRRDIRKSAYGNASECGFNVDPPWLVSNQTWGS
jgi:hypothetical protein